MFCALQPWYIETPLAAPVIIDSVKLAEVESRTPMKRVGQPEEVSGSFSYSHHNREPDWGSGRSKLSIQRDFASICIVFA